MHAKTTAFSSLSIAEMPGFCNEIPLFQSRRRICSVDAVLGPGASKMLTHKLNELQSFRDGSPPPHSPRSFSPRPPISPRDAMVASSQQGLKKLRDDHLTKLR